MVATALAFDRVQPAVSVKPQLKYTKGCCPTCTKPMLVLASQPNAPCTDCYAK